MKKLLVTLALSSLVLTSITSGLKAQQPSASSTVPVVKPHAPSSSSNPSIDASGFRQTVNESLDHRERKLLSETAFIKAMQEKGVVILDARSANNFRLRHISGAVNLPFTEFTASNLAKVIPKTDSKVLIYCNNNFNGSPISFSPKTGRPIERRGVTALNLSTYAALWGYGYTNIYELEPLLEVSTTSIPFTGTEVTAVNQVSRTRVQSRSSRLQ